MGFHIDTHNIPSLRDFADASKHESTVTPIRGNGAQAGRKPLTSNRRATHMRIRRERNIMSPLGNQGMAIMCTLYDTDCVIFYEDNSVTLATGGWTTISTRMFINAIMYLSRVGVGSAPKDSESNVLYCGVPPNRKDFLWRDKVHLGVDRLPIDPEPCVVHRVNRRAMNEVRKLNAPFRKYVHSMVRVAYPQDAMIRVEDFEERCLRLKGLGAVDRGNFPNSRNADTLCNIMREDNIEDWADALELCALMTMDSRWDGSNSGGWQRAYFCMPQRITKLVDEVLKYGYADSVFYEVELPRGEVKADPNAKYVR